MKKDKNNILIYVVVTYLLFWFMVLGVCGVAVFVFDAPQSVMKWLIALSSWTPTVALLILFKRLNPNTSLKMFYRDLFKERINFKILLYATLLIIGIFLLSASSIALSQGLPLSTQLQFALPALLGNIFFTAIQGASGEESGWRGYLLPQMEKKHGFVKGNILLGLIWAFWHAPLWFISTSYTGLSLMVYILVFIVSLVSFSIMMAIFMKKWRHLFLAFWMHFLFNFVLTFFAGQDLYLLIFMSVFYFASAVFLTILYSRKEKNKSLILSTESSS